MFLQKLRFKLLQWRLKRQQVDLFWFCIDILLQMPLVRHTCRRAQFFLPVKEGKSYTVFAKKCFLYNKIYFNQAQPHFILPVDRFSEIQLYTFEYQSNVSRGFSPGSSAFPAADSWKFSLHSIVNRTFLRRGVSPGFCPFRHILGNSIPYRAKLCRAKVTNFLKSDENFVRQSFPQQYNPLCLNDLNHT